MLIFTVFEILLFGITTLPHNGFEGAKVLKKSLEVNESILA